MKIVVSGATGLVGRHLLAALVERDEEITVLSRRPERAQDMLGNRVKAVRWDDGDSDLISTADIIINLAGEPIAEKRWTAAQKDRIRHSRLDVTGAIVRMIGKSSTARPKVLINASAIGYYGSGGDRPLDESSPAGDGFLASVCAAWEDAARPATGLGVRVVYVRTGIVLSSDGGALPRFALPFKLGLGGNVGPPANYVSWIHVQDEVGVILHATDHDSVSGAVNSVSPNPVTMGEFSRVLGHALHRPVWFPILANLTRLGLGQRAESLFASQRVMPRAALDSGYTFAQPELDGALREIFA